MELRNNIKSDDNSAIEKESVEKEKMERNQEFIQ